MASIGVVKLYVDECEQVFVNCKPFPREYSGESISVNLAYLKKVGSRAAIQVPSKMAPFSNK